MTSSRPKAVLIAGPTASGKSGLAVRLAQALDEKGKRAVILNADSQQVYADLRVLSARPTDEEMCNVEHRLFGTWDGAQACSARVSPPAPRPRPRRDEREAHSLSAVLAASGGAFA